LTDADANTVQLYEYSVYGRVAASDPNHTNPFLFTGRRFDADTGLYYYRARYYNPYIGRFLQTDPTAYGDGLNLYIYCGNNPLNWLDPWGLCRDEDTRERSVFWDILGDMADLLLALKEVSDIIEVEAGWGLGLEAKGQVGPLKGQAGASITADALKVEQSTTTIVSGASAGVSVQAGENVSVGPSVSIEMDRMTGEADVSFTPVGFEHKSGVSGEPWKIAVEGTAVIFKGKVAINLNEVLDLVYKYTGTLAEHAEAGYTMTYTARP
jgi:RHS repeat-associated protein